MSLLKIAAFALLLVGVGVLTTGPDPASAAISSYDFDDPQQEQQYRQLTAELRCPKCQNQNIADSDAPLAADLRQKVYGMLQQGQTSDEIVAYMVQRYGDFVTYRPPLKPLTWALWFGPALLLLLVAVALLVWIKRRNRSPLAGTELDAVERDRLQQLLERYREEPR